MNKIIQDLICTLTSVCVGVVIGYIGYLFLKKYVLGDNNDKWR
jgi:hypothetical protein